MASAADPTVTLTRTLAVGSLLGMILLSLAWELWLAPLRPGGSWLALKALPLCIPLAGLLKNRMYTYRWVSLMVWLYFTEGVVRAWGDKPPGNWLALAQVALCVTLFVACALFTHANIQRTRTQHMEPCPVSCTKRLLVRIRQHLVVQFVECFCVGILLDLLLCTIKHPTIIWTWGGECCIGKTTNQEQPAHNHRGDFPRSKQPLKCR